MTQAAPTRAMLDLLATRRSVAPAALQGPGPTRDELDQLLKLAARVPDHGKLAPWRFIVFEGEARWRAGEIIAQLYRSDHPDAAPERIEIERRRLALAPLVVAVASSAVPHAKIPEWEQVLSAGAVCMNLTIAARAMGFASAWLTEWCGYDRRVLSALGVAEHEKIAGFLHIGRAAHVPEDRVRPDMAAIVSYF